MRGWLRGPERHRSHENAGIKLLTGEVAEDWQGKAEKNS